MRGVCEKPRIKCADCANRRFLAIGDEAIRWHLSGRDPLGQAFTLAVYPMLQDETCFFLAVDLDGTDWRDDARALWETCPRLAVPAALERSRSGNGAHLWLFFAEAVPATLAGICQRNCVAAPIPRPALHRATSSHAFTI